MIFLQEILNIEYQYGKYLIFNIEYQYGGYSKFKLRNEIFVLCSTNLYIWGNGVNI